MATTFVLSIRRKLATQKCFKINISHMSSMGSSISTLQKTINRGAFYELSDTEILKQIRDCFSSELARLKNVAVVEKGSSPKLEAFHASQKRTASEILYGKNFDEVNRTLTSILALRWIHNNDYETFVSGQSPSVILQKDSFEWLRAFFVTHLEAPEDLFALVLSLVVNDLGKDPDLEEDYYHNENKSHAVNLKGQNHDTILLEAAKVGMVPSLNFLSTKARADVLLGLELGSQLNAGQLAQAENVPINLEGLLGMQGRDHAFHLKFMEQILDVAGASAHFDPRGARNFIEPVFQGFKTVYEVSLDIIGGSCSLRQGYDKVLIKRNNMLKNAGFRELSVSIPEERALLRLLTMGRTTTKEQAQLFLDAFYALDQQNRTLLVTGLNIDGNDNEAAILPYYMPAMLSESLNTTKDLPATSQQRALTSLMRYLARVLRSTGVGGLAGLQDLQNMPENWVAQLRESQRQMGWIWEEGQFPGIVVERNMSQARETINSEAFRRDPNLLDKLDIPPGQVVQRRRTSHSVDGKLSDK